LHNYRTDKEIEKLEKTHFYDVWKSIRNDSNLKVFTSKPFPNTIYWNASKHDGITKKVNLKEIEFKSNEGDRTLLYSDFVSVVRELYSLTVVLEKINLMIGFQTKAFY
jgi:hypothetical protein